MTHRYYDPGTGKFLTRDPIGYQGGVNLYGFCDGNPVNESDPDGTFGKPPGALLEQPTADPLNPNQVRVWESVGRSLFRLAIKPIGLGGLRIAGGSVALFFMAQTRVADSSTGPGSPYAATQARRRRVTLPNYRASSEDPALAEAAFRAELTATGIDLAPKNGGVYAGGPDAVRTGGAPTAWAFAELKPDNPRSRKDLGSQVRRRLRDGTQGPGGLYAYSKDENGNYVFRYIGIITQPDQRITR